MSHRMSVARRLARGIVFGAAVSLLATAPAAAEAQSGGQSLEQAASDPTASLMAVQIQDNYVGAHHNLSDESANTIQLRAAAPFKTGHTSHIARVTIPYVTESPSGANGLSDIVLFDLVVFDRSWGRWGIGPVLLLPTATEDKLGAEQWAAGPAVGFVASEQQLLAGVFNQNLFSFAGDDNRSDVRVSIIQPIVNYSLPNKWSVGSSEMNVTYDWERGGWSNLPLGAKVAKLMKVGKMPVQWSGFYEYNFETDGVAPKWTMNFTAKLLFPL